MSFNVASLPVALGGMVASFNVPPTTVATGIVMYSMLVAGFVMLGAKLNQRFGAVRVFRIVVLLFGLAQVLMTFSPNATVMIIAQALSGAAGAALLPSLVALIAENYRGAQQATALGALVWLAFVVRNDWSAGPVLIGLIIFGIGQGSLVTLVFNVLVTASPKDLAGDVGSLRGTTNNLAAAVGTAVAGALLVGLLSTIVLGRVAATPTLTPEVQAMVNLDSINFISNDRLKATLETAGATPEQVSDALAVNTGARPQALKIGLLLMAGLALITIIPAGRLPDYKPGEIPDPDEAPKTS